MNFSKVLYYLKLAFSIAFNIVSKFASCPVASKDIPGAGSILTIPEAEGISVVVIVVAKVRVARLLLLAVVIRTVV